RPTDPTKSKFGRSIRRIPMNRNNGGCWTAVFLVGLVAATACAEEQGEASASAKRIAQWIQQLDDDSFSVRDAASKNLVKSGRTAIEAVAAAAVGKSLEASVRAVRILDAFASSAEAATARSAKESLAELAASDHPAAARARNVLRTYQERI